MKLLFVTILLIITIPFFAVTDSLMFKHQLSGYVNYNPSNTMDLGMGARWIPQANYELHFEDRSLLDFEGSLNAYGNAGFQLLDSASFSGDVNPYRLWARYSTEQFEFRLGLQKIDFGQASMLRPLRWFDSVDPRDPLGISEGVYGVLGRYYFLNNTNVWLWGLYGNDGLKGMEVYETSDASIEYGGRIQSSFLQGEIGLNYHHRQTSIGTESIPVLANENRAGFDARWDFLVGAYAEGAWVHQSGDVGTLSHQYFLTLAMDYTFAVGAGLYAVVEHLMVSTGEHYFDVDNSMNMTALQMSYPIGMFDNLGTIVYYDWANDEVYTFVNWFRQYDQMTFYLMAYWNPENAPSLISGMGASENLMSGRGAQAMVVFNF